MHHNALALFTSIIIEHSQLIYAVLFLAMIIEGEFFLMAVGVLVHLGALQLGETFFVAYAGVLMSDIFWYNIGVYLKNHHSNHRPVKWLENKTARFLVSAKEKPFKAMFISKFISGLNHSTLILLGFLKVDFKYFIKAQIIISFLWTLLFLALGFLFGYAAFSFTHRLNKFLLIALVLIISVLFVDRILRHFIGNNGNGSSK